MQKSPFVETKNIGFTLSPKNSVVYNKKDISNPFSRNRKFLESQKRSSVLVPRILSNRICSRRGIVTVYNIKIYCTDTVHKDTLKKTAGFDISFVPLYAHRERNEKKKKEKKNMGERRISQDGISRWKKVTANVAVVFENSGIKVPLRYSPQSKRFPFH